MQQGDETSIAPSRRQAGREGEGGREKEGGRDREGGRGREKEGRRRGEGGQTNIHTDTPAACYQVHTRHRKCIQDAATQTCGLAGHARSQGESFFEVARNPNNKQLLSGHLQGVQGAEDTTVGRSVPVLHSTLRGSHQ